jgi:hypothetical protein
VSCVEFYGGPLDGAKIDLSVPSNGEHTLSCGCRFVTWHSEYGTATGAYPCGRDLEWHQTNLGVDYG